MNLEQYRPALRWSLDTGGNPTPVRKFGNNPSVEAVNVPEDVWSGGGIWVAPTQARTHAVASTQGADVHQVQIWGLTSWYEPEVTETVPLQGVTPVNTANQYVIIHRMRYQPGYLNTGLVTATAATDGTVTAQIEIGHGQTSMAVYGVPAGQGFMIDDATVGINRDGGASGYAEFVYRVALDPTIDETAFHILDRRSASTNGNSDIEIESSHVPIYVLGPAIIKAQVSAVANTTRVYCSFNGYLFDL